MRGRQRRLYLFRKVAGGKPMLVAEERRQALGENPVRGQPAGERMRHPEALELAMEPVGQNPVLVAVAEESIVTGQRTRLGARLRGLRLRRAVVGRQSGMLPHRTPPRVPLYPC